MVESGREEPPKDPQHQAETTPKPHRNNHFISSMSREHGANVDRSFRFYCCHLLSIAFRWFRMLSVPSIWCRRQLWKHPQPGPKRSTPLLGPSAEIAKALGSGYQKPTRKRLAPLKHGKNWNKLQSKQINHMHTLWWRVRLSKREIKSFFQMAYQDSMRLLISIMIVFSSWLIKPQVITFKTRRWREHRAIFWNHGRSDEVRREIAFLQAALATFWSLCWSYADRGVRGVFAFKPHQWQSKPSRTLSQALQLPRWLQQKFKIHVCYILIHFACHTSVWFSSGRWCFFLYSTYPAAQINGMWFQVKHSHLPKVSLQVAFCRELGGGDLVANLFTNLHKVTKGKKK